MKIQFSILLVFLLFSYGTIRGQNDDDQSNLLKYTPSLLLSKGQTELKVFNNLYTQTAFYDAGGKKTPLDERSTFFTSINQILMGITPRLNVGYMVFFRSVRLDSPDSSPFQVFQSGEDSKSRSDINFAGPTVRFAPFKANKHLSFQSTYLMPTAYDQEGIDNNRPFLDFDKHYWWTQLYYDKVLPNYFVLFLEIDLVMRLDYTDLFKRSFVYNPVKLFFGKFLGSKWGVYTMAEWAPFWGDQEVLAAYYLQTGVGIKHQVHPNLELEAVYTLFPSGKNSGAGETFNFALRFLK